jgi:hypothetical protein
VRTQIPGSQIRNEDVDTEDLKDGAVSDVKMTSTGVAAGSYTKVTVNEKGRVEVGENPTTLAGYGITDAVSNADAGAVSFTSVTDESATYPNSRRLTATTNEIDLVDAGAGSTLTVGLADNPVVPGTDALTLPAGTTAQRGTATNGKIRFNSTTSALETAIGATWKNIVLDDDKRLAQDHVMRVSKDPAPGEFSSIAAACAAIAVINDGEQWLVEVGPGSYSEPTITVPTNVHIAGFTEYAVYISPDNTTDPLFVMAESSTLSWVNVLDVTGTNQVAFRLHNVGDYGVLLHKVCLDNVQIGWDIVASTSNSTVYLEYCDTAGGTTGLQAISSNGFWAYVNAENFYVYAGQDGVNPTIGVKLSGADTSMNMQSFGFEGEDGLGDGFHLENGARLDAKAGSIYGWDTGCHLSDLGVGSVGNFIGVALHDNTTYDLHAEHVDSAGVLYGTADRAKVNAAAAPNFVSAFADILDNEFVQTGAFYMGATQGTLTNVTDLIIETPPMGLLSGGVLSPGGGLVVNISAGTGYLRKDGPVTRVEWSNTSVTLTPGTTPYIYIDKNGAAQLASSEPDSLTNIVLGRAGAGASSLTSLGSISIDISSYGNKVEKWFRETVGPVYVSGSIVTENTTTARAIDVTSGKWYYGTKQRNPSAKTAPNIIDVYRSGGVTTTAVVTTVPNGTIDNGTNLVAMTSGYYTKHVLFQSSDGAFQSYYLAHGQAEYATLAEAREAPQPSPRITPDSTPKLAEIIMQEGNNSIVEIIDVRPLLMRSTGVSTSGGGGVSAHGDLTGLSNDDHMQYLLVDGTRSMTGNLNLGTNNITNVGTVDGVDVSAHAARHLPSGADPLATAAASGLNASSTNTEGIANSLARSDHTHAITGFQPSDTDLTALAGLSTTGLVVRTGAGTAATRSIAVGSGLSLTNADGVAGNPTISLQGNNTAATGTLSSWTLVSGTRYRSDFAHNLGTNNVVITLFDTSNNTVVTADEITLTDTNTVRVQVIGNSRTLRIVVVANGLAINAGTMSAGTITTAKDSVNVSTAASRLNFTGQAVSVVDAGSGTTNVTVGSRFTFFAAAFETPNNADWAVNALAPSVVDPSFGSLTVRQFSNSAEQGVGFLMSAPAGATSITFRFRGRAQTAPGSAAVVQPRVYLRAIPDNAAMGSWSAGTNLSTIAIPTNAFFQHSNQTVTLASLGMTAGNTYQVELTRQTGVASDLAANFLLAELTVEIA